MLPVYGGSYAVGKDWDQILDKYESLCESCLQLKLKAEAGEKVSRTAFAKLFSSLSELRTELRDGSGSMTEQQRERFESIRARYAAVFGGTQAVAQEKEHPVSKPTLAGNNDKPLSNASKAPAPQASAPQATATNVHIPKATATNDLTRVPTVPQDSVPQRPESLPRLFLPGPDLNVPYTGALAVCSYRSDVPRDVVPRRVYGSVSFVMAVWPVLSYGASLSLFDKNTLWGGYASFHSNFRSVTFSYTCSSDSTWEGGTMWPSGNSSVSLLQISAGIRKNFGPWFGIFAGAGYGRKAVLWEDLSGEWVKVQDLSTSGILLECGLLLDAGPVEIQAGLSTIAFRTVSLELGLGFRF